MLVYFIRTAPTQHQYTQAQQFLAQHADDAEIFDASEVKQSHFRVHIKQLTRRVGHGLYMPHEDFCTAPLKCSSGLLPNDKGRCDLREQEPRTCKIPAHWSAHKRQHVANWMAL